MRRRAIAALLFFAALPFITLAGACTPYAVSTTSLPMACGFFWRLE